MALQIIGIAIMWLGVVSGLAVGFKYASEIMTGGMLGFAIFMGIVVTGVTLWVAAAAFGQNNQNNKG